MIYLYKNGILELTLKGNLENNKFIGENFFYDLEKKLFFKEEENYSLTLDFINKNGLIKLKGYEETLSLVLNNVELEVLKNKHKIRYKLETEEDILNELEVNF